MFAIASEQRGLVTLEQLRELGFTKGRRESWLRSGRLHRVFQGVYAAGRPMLSREGRWLAAILACGSGAVLSHLSAAVLWDLIAAEGLTIDVTAPRSRKSRPGISVHRPRRAPRTTVVRGIPVTTISQTLEDLARSFSAAALRRAVGEAELHPAFVADELPPRIWALVDGDGEGGAVSRSRLESRFRRICREAGLPRPERNQRWGDWEIDFLWREQRVAVETDGRNVHTRRVQFARDRQKDRDLQLAGLVALRFTWGEVRRRPDLVVATCRRALGLPES